MWREIVIRLYVLVGTSLQNVAGSLNVSTLPRGKNLFGMTSFIAGADVRTVHILASVHRSELSGNLTATVRTLFRIVEHGALAEILAYSPRLGRPVSGANRRLSAAEIDQLVEDYRSGVGSIYDLADIYGVHRNTVSVHLKERGVMIGKQPLNDREVHRARALRQDGFSLNAIGRALGRDPKTVKAAVASE